MLIPLNKSKSLYIRYLIAHYVYFHEILSVSEKEAEDVKIVASCLEKIEKNRNSEQLTMIDVKDCGAAWRFLLPILVATKGNWLLTGTERLRQRPILPLVEALQKCGGKIEQIQGSKFKIQNLEFNPALSISIDVSQSSQFASALLLTAPLLGLKQLQILPENPAPEPYIRMTEEVVRDVKEKGLTLDVADIESDWSAALFWYAVAALSETAVFELEGLRLPSLQGDSIVNQWFDDDWGIVSTCTDRGILIEKKETNNKQHAVCYDLKNHIDLAPVLCVLAILSGRKMSLLNIQNLNLKESKRLNLLVEILSPFAEMKLDLAGNVLEIRAIRVVVGEMLHFNSHHDHRLVMAFSLFGIQNQVEIEEIDAIKKSYPNYFEPQTAHLIFIKKRVSL